MEDLFHIVILKCQPPVIIYNYGTTWEKTKHNDEPDNLLPDTPQINDYAHAFL